MILQTSSLIENLHGLHFVKDLSLRYVAGSCDFVKEGGFSNASKLTQLTDFDMPWAPLAEEYRLDDQRAMAEGSIQKIELFLNHHKEEHLVMVSKRALYENGKVVGVIGSGQVITPKLQQQLLSLRTQRKLSTHHQFEVAHTYPLLTERESCILFYLIRAKSPKEIANLFSISHRTVEKHIEKIKNKLKVTSKSELISFAWENEMGDILLRSQIGTT